MSRYSYFAFFSDAPALLSSYPGENFGLISAHEENSRLQDLSSCIIRNYGGGWKANIQNGNGNLNTETDPKHWIQVDFPETMKIVKMVRSVARDGDSPRDAWLVYGPDEDTLTMYQDEDGEKVYEIVCVHHLINNSVLGNTSNSNLLKLY